MPMNGAGVTSWPPNTVAIPNTTIESGKYNAFLADLLSIMNTPRPYQMGGTGASTQVGGNDALNTTSANIASAGTTDLATATGVVVNVTGNVTITALGTVASGALRTLVFSGAPLLTHNAVSLILPGAANIQAAAGDVAQFRSKGGGNWVCVGYQRAAGGANFLTTTDNALARYDGTGGKLQNSSATIDDNGNLALTSSSQFMPQVGVSASFNGTAAGYVLFVKSRAGGAVQVGDNLGTFAGQGISTDLGTRNAASFGFNVTAVGASTVSGNIAFSTDQAGSTSTRMTIAAGMYMAAATGTDKGAGTINAVGYYVNGNQIPFSAAYESAQQTITSGGSLTLAHGLGVKPKLYLAVLQCTTADGGYSIGDEVTVNPALNTDSGVKGQSIVPDATNINIRFNNNAGTYGIVRKDTGALVNITIASWRLVVRAWA